MLAVRADAPILHRARRALTRAPVTVVVVFRALAAREGDESIQKLMEMGFSREQCVAALESNEYDENRALDALLSGA